MRISLSGIEDATLWKKVQSDDSEAFSELFDRYHAMLYSQAYFYLKDPDQAKDIVQQVFLKVWTLRSSIEIGISVKNYLFTMARNQLINTIRRDRFMLERNYEMAQETPLYEKEELPIEETERMNLLYRAVDRLPESQRHVCKLRLEEELTLPQIAQRMNLTLNTVKTHYRLALRNLRMLMPPDAMLIVLLLFYK